MRPVPLLALALVCSSAVAGEPVPAPAPGDVVTTWHELALDDGVSLRWAEVAPAWTPDDRPLPLLLALPPGRQDKAMVELALSLYWTGDPRAQGWRVVSPVMDDLLGDGEARVDQLVPLLDALARRQAPEGGRAYLAGVSSGGRSAFALAARHPERFAALLGAPGVPSDDDDARLRPLVGMPVRLWVGGDDDGWRGGSERVAARLVELGGRCTLTVFEGEGHQPESLVPGVLFDALEELRAAATAAHAVERAVAAVLDDLHAAASAADEARYFAHYTDDAVFLGTDASERWTMDAFRAYAHPVFERGLGWTYVPTERHVFVASDGGTAWFDERLDNADYGEARGTGVLVRDGATWKVAQYNLTFPVPNAFVPELVKWNEEHGGG